MRSTVCGVLAALAMVPATARAQPHEPGAAARPVTLEEAVRQALARHPTAAIAAAEIQRSQALLRQARATSLPSLTWNGIYTRLDDDRTFSGRVVAPANQISANLLLSVPLLAPQRWVQWSHARDSVEIAQANADDVRRAVAVSTARAYITVLSQKRIVEVDTQARATAQSHFEFAKAQWEGGIGSRIDQVRAEQELAMTDSLLQQARIGLVRAQEALGVFLGSSDPVDTREAVSLPALPGSVEGAADEASVRRADLRLARTRLRAADRVARDSWTDYTPLLVGNFQPFFQNPPTLTTPETGWQATLVLVVPLYDGGQRYGQAAERDVLAAQAHTQLDAALRQARSEVRVAFEALRRADEALASARKGARLASEALELANLAYRAGATTNLEVTDAERRARDAETSVAIAEDAARQARLDLLAASGRFP